MTLESHITPTGPAALGLGGVLVSSLPPTLLTETAPVRYTVEAVFTRRPEREEIVAILGDGATRRLAEQGYPNVELAVTDRRLEIGNTSLEELGAGLATAIGDLLAGISADIRSGRADAAERFQEAAGREQERAAAVTALAGTVSFAPASPGHEPRLAVGVAAVSA